MVEKVIIGEIDEDGNKNPYKITFVFKTGFKTETSLQPNKVGRKRNAPEPKNGCSGGDKIYSFSPDNTRRSHLRTKKPPEELIPRAVFHSLRLFLAQNFKRVDDWLGHFYSDFAHVFQYADELIYAKRYDYGVAG
jgi:hypothetical protein